MRARTVAAIIAAPVVFVLPGSGAEAHERWTPTCNGEAGPEFARCAWDAKHEGNGKGRSYVTDRNGNVTYVPHWVAHRLRSAEAAPR